VNNKTAVEIGAVSRLKEKNVLVAIKLGGSSMKNCTAYLRYELTALQYFEQ
jgi:hypothetical protein